MKRSGKEPDRPASRAPKLPGRRVPPLDYGSRSSQAAGATTGAKAAGSGEALTCGLLRKRFNLRLFPLRLAAFVAKTRVFRQLRATCAVLVHHFKCRMSSAGYSSPECLVSNLLSSLPPNAPNLALLKNLPDEVDVTIGFNRERTCAARLRKQTCCSMAWAAAIPSKRSSRGRKLCNGSIRYRQAWRTSSLRSLLQSPVPLTNARGVFAESLGRVRDCGGAFLREGLTSHGQ